MTVFTDLDFLGIKNQLAAALNTWLGDYVYPNGATAKAIAVDVTGNMPSQGTLINIRTGGNIDPTKNGLEVVIRPLTQAEILPLSSQGKRWDIASELEFKQWNPSRERDQDLTLAVMTAINAVDLGADVTLRPRVFRDPQLGNLETQRIEFILPMGYRHIA
jgi:hypothetical protein